MIALRKLIRISLPILITLFFIQGTAFGQRGKVINMPKYDLEPYHFGFILAANEMIYSLKFEDNYQTIWHSHNEWPDGPDASALYVYNILPKSTIGFTVGIVGNLRLGNYFDLRFIPSLSFGERRLEYTFLTLHPNIEAPNTVEYRLSSVTKSLHSTFVEFPLHLKYRSKRNNNMAAYIIGGPSYKIDLASQKKNEREIMVDGQMTSIIDNIRTKRYDVALEIGIGFDFYTEYFKFGTELKMSYGILDILNKDNLIYSTSISKIQNKIFQLSFTFE